MHKTTLMALTAITTCVFTSAAFAQDAMSNMSTDSSSMMQTPPPPTDPTAPSDSMTPATSTSTSMSSTDTMDSGAEKHWAVTLGAMYMQPRNKNLGLPVIGKMDGRDALTASFSFYVNNNWAVELWAAGTEVSHRIHDPIGQKIGTIKQRPYSISGQYEFGDLDTIFRPFIGLGYYQSKFSRVKPVDPDMTDSSVSTKRASGFIGTLGLDMTIDETWFARLDWRFMTERPEITVDGMRTYQKVKMNPWAVGFSVGARF